MSIASVIAPFARVFAGLARLAAPRRALVALLVAFMIPASAYGADGIAVRSAVLEAVEDSWQLDAQFEIEFSPRLEEAVNRGVPLYFIVEFEISRPRWFWFDEKPIQVSQIYKITYTPLLRQYRLSSGAAYQNFNHFDEVVAALSRVRGWPVAEGGALRKQDEYEAAIRMRLDTTQLPKPFQLNAVASNDWNLASDWYRWTVRP